MKGTFLLALAFLFIFSLNLQAKKIETKTANAYEQVFTSSNDCASIDIAQEDKGIMENGFLLALLIVFLGGFLTSFTPCAFPVILISLPSLMKKEGSKKYKFSISITYILGIATMYSSLGIFAALGGGAIGALMQNSIIISIFVIFFIAMALSSLGAFVFQMPSSLNQIASKAGEGKGFLKAFFSGLFLGVLAAPCVGPVLAGVLAYIAKTGNIFLGFSLLIAFALGMGVIIIIVGTFSPNWKSGPWMTKINTIFATVLFLLAMYFMKDIFPVIVVPFNALYKLVSYNKMIFIAIALVIGILGYLFKPFKLEEMFMLELKDKIRKLIGSILMAISLFMILGVFVFIENKQNINWIKLTPQMIKNDSCFKEKGLTCNILDRAKKKNKGILIDFSGKGCAACLELKNNTLSKKEVYEHINKNFIPVYMFYSDSDDDELVYEETDKKFNVNFQWPTVVFIDKCGRFRKELTLKGYENKDNFLKRIKKIN